MPSSNKMYIYVKNIPDIIITLIDKYTNEYIPSEVMSIGLLLYNMPHELKVRSSFYLSSD